MGGARPKPWSKLKPSVFSKKLGGLDPGIEVLDLGIGGLDPGTLELRGLDPGLGAWTLEPWSLRAWTRKP